MKRMISRPLLFILVIVLLLMASGLPNFIFDVSADSGTAIIADHTVVDKYDQIPQQWIDEVKKMYLNVLGQSHSRGYFAGLNLLMELDPKYLVFSSQNPGENPYGEDALKADGFAYGKGTNIGEEYWFTWYAWDDPDDPNYPTENATLIKNHISYFHENGPEISAVGFGWCWDMTWPGIGGTEDPIYSVHWGGMSLGGPEGLSVYDSKWGLDEEDFELTSNSVCMDTYLAATEEYIDHINDISANTTVFFTTGPVDSFGGEVAVQREIKQEYIRQYVESHGKVLFDDADILTHNDDGEQWVETWGEFEFPFIHPDNQMDYDDEWNIIDKEPNTYHIGEVGALRLGKALWWMLARIAGWDGTTETDTEEPSVTVASPNGGEKWKVGCEYDVTWAATDDVGVTSCNISYSIDNGASYIDIATGQPNDITYPWTIPENPSINCLVKVAADDASGKWGQDTSDAVFEICTSILGDANDDGVVNSLDITKTERIILELDTPTDDADANDDDDINILDITKIEQIISNP